MRKKEVLVVALLFPFTVGARRDKGARQPGEGGKKEIIPVLGNGDIKLIVVQHN